MEFYKDTILGQVIRDVHKNKHNELYFSQIDDLVEEIFDQEYLFSDVSLWNDHNLVITDRAQNETDNSDNSMTYVVTENAKEYSWLIERLMEIYMPTGSDVYRLLNTVAYWLSSYEEKADDLMEILRITATASIVFLHPDHLGKDSFRAKPITLPPFGPDY